ncbi:putative Calcium-binding protein [Diplonema papillatum]|nr:putative Calcium-binding protein [Diplonema papillatum]
MEDQLCLVRGISPLEVARFETLFKLFDNDNSGSISIKELANLMPRLGIFLSEEELTELFEATDADSSGDVDFQEFLDLMARQREENQLALLGRDRQSFIRLKESSKLAFRLEPDGVFMSVWECFVLLSVLFFAMAVSTEDCLPAYKTPWYYRVPPGIMFLIDLVLRMTVVPQATGESRDSMVIQQPSLCFVYMRSSSFALDFLAALPIDLIVLPFHAGFGLVVQHLRLTKLLRVRAMWQVYGRELITPTYTVFHFNVFPMVKLIFWGILMVHLFTVVWLALKNEKDISTYVEGLYFVVYTITTTGYGDVPVETTGQQLFAILLFCVATVTSGLVVGKLVKVSQQADLLSDTQTRMMETLAVMKHLRIPHDFAEEILAQQYHRLQNSFSIYSATIDNLPQAMRDRMMLYARMKVVCRVPIFMNTDEICLAKLAQALVSAVVPPDEYVIIAGEEGSEMFFLFHGTCDVWLANGVWIAYIKRGGVFGELALLQATRRAASIKSLTYCQLFRLDRMHFDQIAYQFPELRHNLTRLADERNAPPPKEKQLPDNGTSPANEVREVERPRRVSEALTRQMQYKRSRKFSMTPSAGDCKKPSMTATSCLTDSDQDSTDSDKIFVCSKEVPPLAPVPPPQIRPPSFCTKPMFTAVGLFDDPESSLNDRLSTIEEALGELLHRVPAKDEAFTTRTVLVRNKKSALKSETLDSPRGSDAVRAPGSPLSLSFSQSNRSCSSLQDILKSTRPRHRANPR